MVSSPLRTYHTSTPRQTQAIAARELSSGRRRRRDLALAQKKGKRGDPIVHRAAACAAGQVSPGHRPVQEVERRSAVLSFTLCCGFAKRINGGQLLLRGVLPAHYEAPQPKTEQRQDEAHAPALTRPPEYHRPARKRPAGIGPEKETAWLTPVSTTPRLAPTDAAPHRTCSQSLERPPQAPSFTSRDEFVKLMAPGRRPLCIAPQVAKPDLCPVLCGLSSQLRPKPLLPTWSNANTTGQQPWQVIQRFLHRTSR